MIIDIRTIPAGHSELEQDADLKAYQEELPPLAGRCKCKAAIDRNGTVLYVHLSFEGIFELACSRCLSPYRTAIGGAVRLVVRERQDTDDDDGTADFFFDSRCLSVDLTPALYEEIMTSLPLKPLCSAECRGIEIPAAGGAAADAAADPRWEALRKLKNK